MTVIRDTGELGRLVRARRRALGHTQTGIADLAGVHRAVLGKLERGGSVNFEIVLRVVQVLGADLMVRPRGGTCDPAALQGGGA